MLVSDDAATQLMPQDDTDLEDVSILCIDCQQTFIWTAGEQCFFRDKHLRKSAKTLQRLQKGKKQTACRDRTRRITRQTPANRGSGQMRELRMLDYCSFLSVTRTSGLLPGMFPPIEWVVIKRNA